MKNKFATFAILPLLALLMLSCEERKMTPSTLLQWEKDQGFQARVAERNPSQSGSGQLRCMKDRAEQSELEAQRLLREKKRQQSDADLKNAYLKNFSATSDLSPEQIQSCNDLDCLFKEMYRNRTPREMWIAQNLFLQYNIGISISPKISLIDLSSATREQLYFKLAELQAIQIALYALSDLKTSFPTTLRYFFRLPVNTLFPGKACGIAFKNYPGGDAIGLADSCLHPETVQLVGEVAHPLNYFGSIKGQAILHELGHHVDYARGISSSKDWLSLSKWRKVISHNEAGVSEEKWITDETDFITSYSKRTPLEDWAESFAHFRNSAEVFNSKYPVKSDYISKLVFDGKKFDKPALLQYFQQQIEARYQPKLVGFIEACSRHPKAESPALLLRLNLPELNRFGLDAGFANCMALKVEAEILAAVDDLYFNDYDACETIGNMLPENKFLEKVSSSLRQDVLTRVQQKEDFRLAQIQFDLIEQKMVASFDASEIILDCYKRTDEKACYDSRLRAVLKIYFQDSQGRARADLLDNHLQQKIRLYEYEATRRASFERYRKMLSGFNERFMANAVTLIEDCESKTTPGRSVEFSRSPYDPGSLSLDPGFILCLNTALPKWIHTSAQQSVEARYSLSFDRYKSFLTDLFQADVKTTLDQNLKVRQARAVQSLANSQNKSAEQIAAALISKPEWMTQSNSYAPDCRKQAQALYQQAKMEMTPSPYVSSEGYKSEVVILACQQAEKNPQYAALLKKHVSRVNQLAYNQLDVIIKKHLDRVLREKCGRTSSQLGTEAMADRIPPSWRQRFGDRKCVALNSLEIVESSLADFKKIENGQEIIESGSSVRTYILKKLLELSADAS